MSKTNFKEKRREKTTFPEGGVFLVLPSEEVGFFAENRKNTIEKVDVTSNIDKSVRESVVISESGFQRIRLIRRQPSEDVSTPGHGQGAGPIGYKFCEAGRRRQWEGPK